MPFTTTSRTKKTSSSPSSMTSRRTSFGQGSPPWIEATTFGVIYGGAAKRSSRSADAPMPRRVLVEAPAAVGWERAREVEGRYLGILRDGLTAATKEGLIETEDPAVLAQLLFGLFGEAATLIVNAPDPVAARRAIGRELDAILAGLRKASG